MQGAPSTTGRSVYRCSVVFRYFRHAPAPHEHILQQHQQQASPTDAAQLARSTLRALQLCPALMGVWRWTPALALLSHPDPDVRWCAVEVTALMFGLGDAARAQVAARALSEGQALAAALRWQNERALFAAAAATMYVGGSGEQQQQESSKTGPSGMQVDQEQQQLQQQQRKRKYDRMSSSNDDDEGGDGAAAATTAAAACRCAAGFPPAPGYVEVCGLELPLRSSSESCMAATSAAQQQRSIPPLVLTATVEANLEALALGLCLGTPLLVEGPPGSGKSALVEHVAELTDNAVGELGRGMGTGSPAAG